MTGVNGGIEFSWRVLERMPGGDVNAACRDLRQGALAELARVADVPRVVLTRDSSAGRVLRNRARRGATTAKVIAETLVRPTAALVIAALGDERSVNPTYEELIEVLPAAVARHGARRVALMLAFAVDDKWAAAEPCRRLLETDERFVVDTLGEVVDDETER